MSYRFLGDCKPNLPCGISNLSHCIADCGHRIPIGNIIRQWYNLRSQTGKWMANPSQTFSVTTHCALNCRGKNPPRTILNPKLGVRLDWHNNGRDPKRTCAQYWHLDKSNTTESCEPLISCKTCWALYQIGDKLNQLYNCLIYKSHGPVTHEY